MNNETRICTVKRRREVNGELRSRIGITAVVLWTFGCRDGNHNKSYNCVIRYYTCSPLVIKSLNKPNAPRATPWLVFFLFSFLFFSSRAYAGCVEKYDDRTSACFISHFLIRSFLFRCVRVSDRCKSQSWRSKSRHPFLDRINHTISRLYKKKNEILFFTLI